MSTFTIRDIEYLSGVKAHTIRIWEQRYNFLSPRRSETNIRYYSGEELKTILNIALLNKYGFKISAIDKMSQAEIKENIHSLNDKEAETDCLVTLLVHHMIDLDMEAFEQVLDKYTKTNGIGQAITVLVFAFLEKIGALWQTGHIHPAQEQLVSNVLRQKLMTAIEQHKESKSGQTILLFLPEGEHQELGLLYFNYRFKSKGIRTIYLGANVPHKDVEQILQNNKPDLIFIHLIAGSSVFHLEKFLRQVNSGFGAIPTIISGYNTQHYKRKIPDSVRLASSFGEVFDWVEGRGNNTKTLSQSN